MRRVETWAPADLIDFEHFLAAESSGESADRKIFEEKIRPSLPAEALSNRSAVFRVWLEARREQAPRPTPGECFATGWRTLLGIALVGGLLIGGSTAGALLASHGSEPINAPLFFMCTAGVQIAFLAFGLLAWFGRRWLGSLVGDFGPLRAVLGGLLSATGAALRRLPGERRERIREAMGVLSRRHEIYGSLAQWPLLLVTQLFGVAFNVGILFMMLAIHLPFVELRFGWQSTYDVNAEQMHRAVSAAATPWKWAADHASPSLPEITASRYSRGGSAQSLDPTAARAWWPFLIGSVAVYGLIPRAILFALAATSLRRALRHLRLDHAEANALWRRLTGPIIESAADKGAVSPGENSSAASSTVPSSTAGECLVLLAKELIIDEAALRRAVTRQYGWQTHAVRSVPIDNRRECAAALDEVRATAPTLAGVVVLAPAARDPIMAIALFLRDLEAAAGTTPEILVLLTGAPAPDGSFAPADEERLGIWRRFKNIQRLRAGIERWPAMP